MFDRVKSRSAHLKWHGGSYKESNSSAAQSGTPSDEAPMVVAEEVDAPVTSTKRSSTGSGRSKPPAAKKRAIAPLETGKPAIRTGSLQGLDLLRDIMSVCVRITDRGMTFVFGPCSQRAGQSVVLSASGEARFHSYRGKSGLVRAHPAHADCRQRDRDCSPHAHLVGFHVVGTSLSPIGRGARQAYRRRGLLQSAVHHQVPWPPDLDPAELPDA